MQRIQQPVILPSSKGLLGAHPQSSHIPQPLHAQVLSNLQSPSIPSLAHINPASHQQSSLINNHLQQSKRKPAVRTHSVLAGNELRLIAGPDESASIKLVRQASSRGQAAAGTAEIFGAEMVTDVEYPIAPDSRLAVYTWGGCTLLIKGFLSQEYEAENRTMKDYLNISSILDARREWASAKGSIGPRVIVTGAPSSGKSSLCQMLCNYAVRRGWSPIFVELDPRGSTDKESLKFLPGVIGATVIDSVEQQEPIDPLCFFFGHFDITEDQAVFTQLCLALSGAVHLRIASNQDQTRGRCKDELTEDALPLIAASGFIINAPCQAPPNLLSSLIGIWDVDVVLVVDDPSTRTFLADHFNYREPTDADSQQGKTATEQVSVIGLPKAEGVVAVTPDRLRHLRRASFRSYFNSSCHHVIRVKTTEISLLCLDMSIVPTTALPAGTERESKIELRVCPYTGTMKSLLNSILGMSSTKNIRLVPCAALAGVVHVRNVEELSSTESSTKDGASAVEFALEIAATSITYDGKLPYLFLLVPDKQLKWHPDLHY